MRGSVASFSGEFGITFVSAESSGPRAFQSAEISRLEAAVSEDFIRGEIALNAGLRERATGDLDANPARGETHFRRALEAFESARKTETRRWVREWATAKICLAHSALGRDDDAVKEFFILARLDPYSSFLTVIPLRWTQRAPFATGNSEVESLATGWLDGDNPTAKLLAASILLTSSNHKEAATAALQNLVVCAPRDEARDEPEAAQTCKLISLLATAQLWRLSTLKGPSERELARWAKTLPLFPSELRLGPTLVYAQGAQAAGRADDAERAFLQAALMSPGSRAIAEAGAKVIFNCSRQETIETGLANYR
ncbi:MAG: hypothetical protein HUK22_01075, partial [Thermoguttaceae bacterium]|nr:hypothetical protein [Thermoguttaceae bacterium]